MAIINLITTNTTKSCQVISFCEHKTLFRRVAMIYCIEPFVGERTVKSNTCKEVASEGVFCEVFRTGQSFKLVD